MSTSDSIHIRDLCLRCVLGVHEFERTAPRDVVVQISLSTDLGNAGATDDITQTLDYSILRNQVVDLVENSRFKLIEALAEAIAALCLKHSQVIQAHVIVEKPNAIAGARTVAIEITRRRA